MRSIIFDTTKQFAMLNETLSFSEIEKECGFVPICCPVEVCSLPAGTLLRKINGKWKSEGYPEVLFREALPPNPVDDLFKEIKENFKGQCTAGTQPYLVKNQHGQFAVLPAKEWEKINSELRKHRSENLLREYRPFRFYDPVWGETLDMIYAKPHSKMSEYFTNKFKTPMPKEPEYNSEVYGEKEKKEGFKYSIEIQGKKIRVNKDGDIKWSCGEVIKNKEIEELAEFIDRIKEMN